MAPPSVPILDYAAPPKRRARFFIWIICVLLLLGGTIAWLFFLREWRINSDLILVGGWGALGAVIVVAAILLKTTPTGAIRLSPQTSKWLIVGGAAAMQTAALALAWPVLSEDLVRYRLDGLMWLQRISPYATSPREFQHRTATADAIDEMVTFPDLKTIYPPVAQVVFVGARILEKLPGSNLGSPLVGGRWRDWTRTMTAMDGTFILRLLFAITSVSCTIALVASLSAVGRSAWWAILFAWNPLVVIELGGMGHVDIVGVLFVLLMIRALQSTRPILAAAMLALAAGVKPPVLLLAPFFLHDVKKKEPRARLVWIGTALIGFVLIVYVPAMAYQRGYEGWFRTLRTYATQWEANGSVYNLIKAIPDSSDGVAIEDYKDHARTFAAIATGATLLLAWWRRASLAEAGYWLFLVALLVSPVVYPWYLLWVICFIPLLRGWQGLTGLVWSATIGTSYLLWRTTDWVLPARWLLVEYVPVYTALIIELLLMLRGDRGFTSLPDSPPPASFPRTSAP